MNDPSSTPAARTLDVIVAGAGQAGLAVGHHLARRGLSLVLLEAAAERGHSWRNRRDSLRFLQPGAVRMSADATGRRAEWPSLEPTA